MSKSKIHFILLLLSCVSHFAQAQPILISNPSDCGLAIPIPDFNCAPNGTIYEPVQIEIAVNDAPGILGIDVFLSEVRLIIGHTWVNDLNLTLLSPSGVAVVLTSNNGGGDDDLGNPLDTFCTSYTSFAVGACTPVSEGVAPFLDEPYQPQEHFYNLNDGITPANGNWLLLVCDDAIGDTGRVEFIQLILEPINCLPITEVEILNIDTTSVELQWTPSDFCGTTIIEYGFPSFSPGLDSIADGGAIQIFNCTPITLTGLLSDTQYEVYIRRYCEETGRFSPNTCMKSFQTGCQPPSISAREDFDNSPNCTGNCLATCDLNNFWRNVSNDDMDWIANSGSTFTPGTGPDDDVSGGGKYIYIETSGCNDNMEAILQSPCIILNKQGTDTCHLSFYYQMLGFTIGSLKLEVSEDGGFSWNLLWQQSGNQGSDWHKIYIGLSDYEDGSPLQFRFTGLKTSGVKGDIALDEIVIFGSQVLDYPETVYYYDNDGDNYGDDGIFVLSCTGNPPTGYVLNGGDCDDDNEFINPGAEEIPCDGIDNNCNIATIDDDVILPPPPATSDIICSGEQAIICATPVEGNFILWYDAIKTDSTIAFGNCYEPDLPENNSSVPIEYTFLVGQTLDFQCFTQDLAEVVVIVNPRPQVSTADMPAICPGDSFNLASLNIVDANFTGGQITFHSSSPTNISNEINPPLVSPTVTSTYYFLMTSPDGCTDEGQVDVIAKPGPDLFFLPSDSLSLCQETNTTLEVVAMGGTGDYTYFWNTGASTSSIEVQADFVPETKDIYYVTVTDEEGCFSTDSLQVNSINSIDSISLLVTDVSECMGTDGSIRIIPLNGLGPFDFFWTGTNGSSGQLLNVADTALITSLDQGVYQVEILDSSNDRCSFNLRSAIVQGPGVVILEPSITDVTCYDAADGKICLNVQGSNNVQYLWNTADTTICIDGLSGGIYAVTISSGDCETVLNNLTIAEPDSLFGRCTMIWPSCFDSNDGRIDIAVFGGTAPFQYQWSTMDSSSPFIKNKPAGIYFVTITDINDCIFIKEIVLPAPDELEIVIDSIQGISCQGETDAYIRVIGNGGTPPYHYEWNTGSTSSVQTDLAPGDYEVSIRDLHDCVAIRSFNITNPDLLTLQVQTFTQPLCLGDTTGSITLLGFGGTPPYTFFSESGEMTDNVLHSLDVGEYAFFVKDVNECLSDTLKVTLTSVANLDFGISLTAPLCVGPATGIISLQPNGASPFQYIWETGDTTALIDNLPTGTYVVQVFDAEGCRYDSSIILAAPQVFNLDFSIASPSCFGVNDGIINTIFLNSGTAPFTLEWNDGILGANRTDLEPGNYQLSVSDINNCEYVSDILALEYPESLALEVEEMGGIICFGDSTAYIETNVTGGTPPYAINWLGTGFDTEDIFDLAAGDYRLLISDSKACAIDTTFQINEPDALTPFVDILQGGVCDPVVGDTLLASAMGGTLPYIFTWNTGNSEALLTDIEPGNYSFTVEDVNGCTALLDDIKLRERTGAIVLDTFFVEGISCAGETDASMTAIVSNGSGDYLFHFTPTFIVHTSEDSLTREGLAHSPLYSVTITDVISGCSVESAEITPSQPLPLIVRRDSFSIIQCFGGADGEIFIHAEGGTLPYAYQWYNEDGTLISTDEDLQIVTSGIYTVIVEDAHACQVMLTDSSVVDNNTLLEIDTTIITDVQCRNENTGSIEITMAGGAPPYVFEWSYQGNMQEDLINVPAGNYSLTVTDSDTCRVIFPPFFISQPNSSIIILDSLSHLNCFDDEDGSIELDVSGGGEPYDFFWTLDGEPFPGNSPLLENIGLGQYELLLVDTFDCIRYDTFELIAPEMLLLNIESAPPMPPENLSSATADAAGGTAPYHYLWNTGDTTMNIEILEPALYSVTVTDANDCEITGSILIVQNKELGESITSLNIFPNPSDGLFNIEVELKTRQQLKLEIFDIVGRKVATFEMADFMAGQFSLNLSESPSGVYFLKLSTNGTFATFRQLVKLGGR